MQDTARPTWLTEPDTRTREQRRADCAGADLTALERHEGLRQIAARRAKLEAELELLADLEAGHRDALDGGR